MGQWESARIGRISYPIGGAPGGGGGRSSSFPAKCAAATWGEREVTAGALDRCITHPPVLSKKAEMRGKEGQYEGERDNE